MRSKPALLLNSSSSRQKALHRDGGLVFVAHGNRFANELRKRDYVKGETWKNKLPIRVVLNTVVSDDIA